MRSSPALVAVVVLVAAAGCGAEGGAEDAPTNLVMTPNVGDSGAGVPVVIQGTGFLVKAPGTPGGPIETRHRAWLGTTELAEVQWQSTTQLDATVPASMEPGTYDLTVENAVGSRGTARQAFTVLPRAPFAASLTAERLTVNGGQQFTVTLVLTNNGASEITGIALGRLSVTGADGASATVRSGPTPAAPAALPAGASATLSWILRAGSGAGTLAITVSATGANAGGALTAEPASPVTVAVQRAAGLTASSTASPATSQFVGQSVTMTLVLTNAAGNAGAAVTAVSPTVSPSSGSCTSASPAATADAPVRIAGGSTATFTWTCTAPESSPGDYALGARVTAIDVNTGAQVSSVSVTSARVSFVLSSYRVSVSVGAAGGATGTVSSSPTGISGCTVGAGTCAASFPYGQAVTLTASPGGGSAVAWGGCATAAGNTCTVTATSARSVTASFFVPVALTLSTSGNGKGGFRCAVGAGTAGACSSVYPLGTALVVSPSPDVGSTFAGWGGDCALVPVNGACALTMDMPHSVSGVFTVSRVPLTVGLGSVGGGSGTVTSTPPGISCPGTCVLDFDYGTQVTLTAQPTLGSFQGWSSTPASTACSGTACSLQMTTPTTATATFSFP